MLKTILITGANAGLGKESARQLAQQAGVEKIYLGCRNMAKARIAKQELEQLTGKAIFDIVKIDVSDLDSVRAAVESLTEPVDALVMNAGGTGGKHFQEKTKAGVTQIFAVNLLGHVVLTQELIKAAKLTQVALYVPVLECIGFTGISTLVIVANFCKATVRTKGVIIIHIFTVTLANYPSKSKAVVRAIKFYDFDSCWHTRVISAHLALLPVTKWEFTA